MAFYTVKIPDKHYVGLVKRSDSDLPLAFLTPWGTDSAAKNRMKSVDEWSSRGWAGQKKLGAITIDNLPMTGFKLTSDIRTTSYGGLDKWRIQDPRGFELEITSGNLARLLGVGTLERGEILDSCVWARLGSDNVLLSVQSPDYKEAVEATRLSKIKAKWKDVKIGNTVSLQNTISGVYMGKYYAIDQNRNHNNREEPLVPRVDLEMPVFAILSTDQSQLHLIRNPKLAEIVSTDEKTPAEAELELNTLLQSGKLSVDTPYSVRYHTYTLRALVSSDKYSDVKFAIKFEQAPDFLPLPYRSTFVECAQGVGYLTRYDGKIQINLVDPKKLYENLTVSPIMNRQATIYGRTHDQYTQVTLQSSQVDKILFANVEFETALGNKLKVRM